MHPVFQYPMVIREQHLDTLGHVNNATYLNILEEARWELITSGGFGMEHIKKTGVGPVILEINIRFLKELKLRDVVVIHTQALNHKGKIGEIKQWITNQEGETCTETVMKIGLFDLKSRKLIPPSDDWLKALKIL